MNTYQKIFRQEGLTRRQGLAIRTKYRYASEKVLLDVSHMGVGIQRRFDTREELLFQT